MKLEAHQLIADAFGPDGLKPTEAEQAVIKARLWRWLAEEARKKVDTDMVKQANTWGRWLDELVVSLRLDADFKLKATGGSELTLNYLRYGTDWFEGCAHLDQMVMQVWLA